MMQRKCKTLISYIIIHITVCFKQLFCLFCFFFFSCIFWPILFHSAKHLRSTLPGLDIVPSKHYALLSIRINITQLWKWPLGSKSRGSLCLSRLISSIPNDCKTNAITIYTITSYQPYQHFPVVLTTTQDLWHTLWRNLASLAHYRWARGRPVVLSLVSLLFLMTFKRLWNAQDAD